MAKRIITTDTTEEDIREYKRTVRKPWIFSVATVLLIVLITLEAFFWQKRWDLKAPEVRQKPGMSATKGTAAGRADTAFLTER